MKIKHSVFKVFLLRLTTVSLAFFIVFTPVAPIFAQEIDSASSVTVESGSSTASLTSSNTDSQSTLSPDANNLNTSDSSSSISPAVSSDQPTVVLPAPEGDKKQIENSDSLNNSGSENMAMAETIINDDPTIDPYKTAGVQKTLAPKTDLSSGALSFDYPIEVPPGRNGQTPDLKLTYSSKNNRTDNIVGYGWEVGIPYIERINKDGSNGLYSENYYYSSLDGELISQGSGVFTPKVESGSFNNYSLATSTWTIIDKKGNTYTYGSTTSSRQDDPNDSTHIYRWMLEKVQDTDGNFITYSYYKNAGQIYPSTITYTNRDGSAGIFEIDFNRQTSVRGDNLTVYYPGFGVTTSYLLSNIAIKVNGTTTKTYTFAYTLDSINRSLLNSITVSGTDNGDSITLPATTFSYASLNGGWNLNSSWSWPDEQPAVSQGHTINGQTPKISFDIAGERQDSYKVADLNGDGLLDLVRAELWYDYDGPNGWQRQYVYLNTGSGWVLDTNWTWPNDPDSGTTVGGQTVKLTFKRSGYVDKNTYLIDVNGDGKADVVRSRVDCATGSSSGANKSKVWLNTGSGWTLDEDWNWPLDEWRHDSLGCSVNDGDPQVIISPGTATWLGAFLMDVNGDGLPDIVRGSSHFDSLSGNPFNRTDIWLNTGSGWVYDSNWSWPVDLRHLGTVNGVDAKLTFEDTSGNRVYDAYRFADINGDGLVDILFADAWQDNYMGGGNNGPQHHFVYINTGSGWVDDSSNWSWPDDPQSIGVNSGGTQMKLAFRINNFNVSPLFITDVNHDGLADFVYSEIDNYDPNGRQHNKVYVNTGHGWQETTWNWPNHPRTDIGTINGEAPKFSLGYGGTVPFGADITDADGDGYSDMIYSTLSSYDYQVHEGNQWVTYPGRQYNYLMNSTASRELLTSITLPQGGTETVTYQPSIVGTDNATPAAFETVKQITTPDGTTNYSYSGGKFYYNSATDRQFAGFHTVAVTDPAGNVTTTYFHQGDSSDSSHGEYSDSKWKIGKPYRVEVKDDSDNLYSKTINKWDEYSLGNGSKFVKLTQTVDYAYDGDSSHKDKAEAYSYDNANGNLTQKIEYGLVTGADDGTFSDSGTDDFTTSYTYATDSAHLVGLPDNVTVADHDSNKVKEDKYYYDAQDLGTVIKGHETKHEMWKSGSAYVNTQKTYDSTYGTLASDIDGRGKTISYSSDTYYLYPATITDPLSHSTSYTYNYATGNMTQKTDPNSRVFQWTYDGLNRLTAVKQPDLSSPSTLVNKTTYSYTDTSGAVNIHKTDNLDSSIARETYQYFDGLGRLIQERSEAEDGNYTARDIVYNNRGLKDKESLNYFSSGSSKTSATTTAPLYTNYAYDALSRITSSVNSVGTTTNAYSDWKITTTDANNKAKDLYKDAYDNLVQVDEHNATSTYTTAYQYNYLGNLTKITDALSNVRNFTYDGLGRRLTAQDLHDVSDASYGTWNYTYDDSGNLTQMVDPKGQTVNYTYDDINRKLTENYTGQTGTEITYSYDSGTDGIGHLTGITTNDLTQTNAYNPLGLLKRETKTINSTAYQTDYGYDRQGNITLITYPDNTEVKYDYNSAGLLEKVSKKASGEVTYTEMINDYDYNPLGQVSFRQFQNGVQNWNSYDQDHLYRQSYRFTLLPDTGSYGSGMLLSVLGGESTELQANKILENNTLSMIAGVSTSKQAATKKMRDWYNKMSKNSKTVFTPVSAMPVEAANSYSSSMQSRGMSLLLENNSAPNWPTNQLTEGLWLSDSLTFNPGFEDSFNNWTFYTSSDATNSVDCTMSYSGDCSDKAIVSTAGNYWDSMLSQTLRLDANTNYKLKFRAKAATSTSMYIGANENHDPWYVLGLNKSVNVGTDWKDYEYSFTSWDTDENARVYFGMGEHPTTYWIDDVKLVPDNLNKIKNPSFENNFNDWSFWSYGSGGAAGTDSVICNDSTKGDCSNMIDMTSSGNYWEAQLTHGVSVDSSDDYIITFDAKAASNRDAGLGLAQNHDPWWDLTSISNFSLTTDWKSYQFELAPWQTDSNARLMFYLGANASDVYIDNVRMWKKQDTRITNTVPQFSVIYDDPDSSDTASYYQIQVIGRYNNFSSPLWDSGKTALSTATDEGARTINLSYGGSSLYQDGQKYYWRMRLWDASDAVGPWSNGSDYFIMSGKRAQDMAYSYDNVGNITKIEDLSDTGSAKTADYTYDDLNRLTQSAITNVADGQAPYTENYTYDALGNILSKTGQGTYAYLGNEGSNYANPHAATSINGAAQSYDHNGNLTSDSTWDYIWDYRNRLTEATDGTITVGYKYDQDDNRLWSDNGTVTTVYPNKYYNITSTGTTTDQIFAGNELVATIENNTIHYVHTDHLGGTGIISDENGALEEAMDYYPFGDVRLDEKAGSFDEQRKFTGHEYDEDTGLNYMGARYQNGKLGRFNSQDNLFLAIGGDTEQYGKKLNELLENPQELNSYSYATNNPLKNVDFDGNVTISAILANPKSAVSQLGAWYASSLGFNALGNPLTGALMRHSLTLNPGAVNINEQNQKSWGNVINQIQKSSDFQDSLNKYLSADGNNKVIDRTYTNSTNLPSIQFNSGDLETGIHGTYSTRITGNQNDDGAWNLKISITDQYDYSKQPYKGGERNNALTGVNNAANRSQNSGVISDYGVNINFSVANYKQTKKK